MARAEFLIAQVRKCIACEADYCSGTMTCRSLLTGSVVEPSARFGRPCLTTIRIIQPLDSIMWLDNVSAIRKERIGSWPIGLAPTLEAIGIALRDAFDL